MVLDDWNRQDGVRLWRNQVGRAWFPGRKISYAFGVGGPGGADLLGIVHGTFCAIEVKRQGARLRREQADFLREVVALGGMGLVATQSKAGPIVTVTVEKFLGDRP